MGEMTIDEQLDLAAKMREAGVSWEAISQVVGLSPEFIRRRIDPGFTAHRNEGIRRARAARRGELSAAVFHVERYHIKPEDARRALSTVPPDTRSYQQKFMGDPLPGRSALDKRNSHNPQAAQ
jgi:hypothetical protein